jgi:hypothetical protein
VSSLVSLKPATARKTQWSAISFLCPVPVAIFCDIFQLICDWILNFHEERAICLHYSGTSHFAEKENLPARSCFDS